MKAPSRTQQDHRTAAEKRDAVRARRIESRIDYVVQELEDTAETAARVDAGALHHRITTTNFDYFTNALETAIASLKRVVWRMAQRRSYESIGRWAEKNAIGGTINLDHLKAEIARRSAKLDESETDDEKRGLEQFERIHRGEGRRIAFPAI